MTSIQISSVTFEHHPTGFGVGHTRPRISWRYSTLDFTQNWLQTSYEIEIGWPDSTGSKTYQVQSEDSVLVPWPERDLQSRDLAWVKVRAHGKATSGDDGATEHSTEWSEPATVEVALLNKSDWSAKLITSTTKAAKEETIPPFLLRKVFPLTDTSQSIVKARLYVTAHGVYQAFLNGQRVGDEEMAPGWTSYKHRLLYSTFDVTKLLNTDESNVLAVELAEGWYAGQLAWADNRKIYGDRLAVLAQLEVTLQDGQLLTICSDGTWKSHDSATSRSEIYNGEDHDCRRVIAGWNSDANLEESAWTTTEELSLPSAALLASDMPPVRCKESIAPTKIFKSKSGKTLVDFGQNLVGKLEIRLPAASSDGQTISISHAEVLENEELGTRPLRTAKPIDNITLAAKQPTTWSPKFTFHGFRYVQIDGWPTQDGMPSTEDVTALVMYSDMKRTGWFSCSDDNVSRLHENVLWSMKGNFFSLPTDCPQRDERLGWTGDIQVFAPSANFLFDTQGFLGSWLQDLSSEQLETERKGIPGLVIPDVLSFSSIPKDPQAVWHDVTVLTPYDLYNSSGDIDLLSRQYASMKAWVDTGIALRPDGLLWDQNIWQLADWLDPAAPPDEPGSARTDSVLVADAYLVRVLDTVARVATLLKHKTDADHYTSRAAASRKAFADEYITSSGLMVGDTQTALSLALCFGLLPTTAATSKAASRLAHLVHLNKYRISTGFAGTPLVTHALSDNANLQLAYRMVLETKCPSWLYPITMGATTIWERWDSMLPDGSINPGQMTSFNHYALGAVAHWLHKTVGGISPLKPGWKDILVRPRPGGTITSAEVAYESPYGRIECRWRITAHSGGDFDMDLVVPPNATAKVVLPYGKDWEKKTLEEDLKDARSVGSGKHKFTCEWKDGGGLEWPPRSEWKRSTQTTHA